jgi:hypothetical protein
VTKDCEGKQVQKTKEMGAKGRRMGVWIHTLGSIPCLSSPASGSPSGTTVHAHIARSAYPGADKWAKVPLVSRHWTAKWWFNGAETESPRIPYAWRADGLGIMVMIASGPATSAEQ